MKALAVLAACVLFSGPALAFGQGPGGGFHPGAPHPGGSHPGGFHPGGFHPGHGHRGPRGGFGPGLWGGYVAAPIVAAPEPERAVAAPEEPVAQLAPAPYCPTAAPAPRRPSGPHIIYIGHKPTIHGPKVIYGAE